MVRTRRSAGAAQREDTIMVGGSTAALPKSSPSGGGPRSQRRSLRSSTLGETVSNDTSSRESVSSATTPPSVSSADTSGYSTPLTSNIATPAGEKIQINISARPPPAYSAQAPNKSIYNISSRKRRRDEVDDSEDDLSDELSSDAKLAMQLQEEEWAATRAPASSFKSTSFTANKRPALGKGKAPAAKSMAWKSVEAKLGRRSLVKESTSSSSELSSAESDSEESISSEPSAKPAPRAAPRNLRRGKVTTVDSSEDEDSAEESDNSEMSISEPDVIDSDVSSEAASTGAEDSSDYDSDDEDVQNAAPVRNLRRPRAPRGSRYRDGLTREERDRAKLEESHPEIKTLWQDFEAIPVLTPEQAEQPKTISRLLKPFQLKGLAWMKAMEKTKWEGGLLGDEMGLGKTIQAVSLIMSDWPAKHPTLVLAPPVALIQWMTEIESYTDGTLKTMVYHLSNAKNKHLKTNDLKKFDVIIMSYNSLESMYRKQEKGFKRKDGIYIEDSLMHMLKFHRVILDEAHYIKTRTTMTSKACFALNTKYRWCLTGTPLQNRIGEFFSLIRFLKIEPFANYLCRDCKCSSLEWTMDENYVCTHCKHGSLRHISVFNQELLTPIQKFGNTFLGAEAFKKLQLLTSRIMLRRQKKDHMDAMELPVKQVIIDRQFFGEEEHDFAGAIMHGNKRKFDTYVAQGVVLNNYANIFGLLTQMRQVADHPDLILKKHADGGQNALNCCICDDTAEDAIRSQCKHDFCRACASSYIASISTEEGEEPTCPKCHIALSIDLEQPEVEQDQELVKKSSIINRIRMEQWTSSTKIEMLVHELQRLRSDSQTHKSIVFSQFTSMLQLIEWRLRRAGITTVMLDGTMTPAQRAASIAHFMGNIDVEVFLVSLKAGGVALNLTEASRVFIVDPWWNPAAEWQSADRCHRIGQTRPCIITRLCIEDSIESRIVQLQEKKTKMINSTVNADGAALDSLDPEDLQFLFRGT